jgi:thiazole synthase
MKPSHIWKKFRPTGTTIFHAAEAMELGVDAVLVNTALADTPDYGKMAEAFALAMKAGRLAHLAGLGPARDTASASSPLTGFLE